MNEGLKYALCALSFFRTRNHPWPRFAHAKKPHNQLKTVNRREEWVRISRAYIAKARHESWRGSIRAACANGDHLIWRTGNAPSGKPDRLTKEVIEDI